MIFYSSYSKRVNRSTHTIKNLHMFCYTLAYDVQIAWHQHWVSELAASRQHWHSKHMDYVDLSPDSILLRLLPTFFMSLILPSRHHVLFYYLRHTSPIYHFLFSNTHTTSLRCAQQATMILPHSHLTTSAKHYHLLQSPRWNQEDQ